MSDADRQHSKYGASSSHRWMECPGSVRLSASAPPRAESAYAAQGTKAHHILEAALRNDCRSATQAWTDHSDYFYEDVDADMCAAVQECIDYVYNILDSYPDAQLLVEQKFDLPTANAPGEAYGYNDVCIYAPSIRWLWVIDYKHGAGVAVDAEGNKQLRFYGAGAVFGSLTEPCDGVTLTIVQPRAFHAAGHVREWHVTVDTLLDFLAELDDAIAATMNPRAPLVPGEKQCKWCPASVMCPALEARALAVVGETFASVKDIAGAKLQPPQTMPVDRLAYILEAADVLGAWVKECEDYALELARQGYSIPGRKLVEAQARRHWYGEEATVAQQLMALADVSEDEVRPRKLISITDAERMVVDAYKAKAKRGDKKKAAEDAKQAMAFLTLKQSSGNTTLVPLTDKRPAVSVAGSAFSTVTVPALPTP